MRILLTLAAVFAATPAPAADWPHWMGPTRDNVWREAGILDKFPAGGPKVLWRVPLAGGYAGPAVANGRVFAADFVTGTVLNDGNFGRKPSPGQESFKAFDAATGKELWKHSFPVTYAISYPAGPRCTPTVDGDKVYFLGAEGHLLCCETATGKIVWQKELKDEYKTKSALWGYAAHPLIDGKKLITLAGGDGSHVVALDKETGKELWRSQSQPEQGYTPPSIITTDGVRQLLVTGPTALRALDPETGERLWTTKYDATSGSVIMTPVVVGEYLFLGGYDNKNLLVKLPKGKTDTVEVVFKDKRNHAISPVNVQPFVADGLIYGFDANGRLYAVEVPSGKRVWESEAPLKEGTALGSGTAFLVKNGDRFVMFNELGEIVLCKLSPKGYEEIDRAKVIDATGAAFGRKVVWCQPAFADKSLFVRNDKELIRVDLSK
ncbi:MAG: PQQ-binding-like beta-propeller repeat protein [Fimbriiglobus sp.]